VLVLVVRGAASIVGKRSPSPPDMGAVGCLVGWELWIVFCWCYLLIVGC
jgi:hypothetical protein